MLIDKELGFGHKLVLRDQQHEKHKKIIFSSAFHVADLTRTQLYLQVNPNMLLLLIR